MLFADDWQELGFEEVDSNPPTRPRPVVLPRGLSALEAAFNLRARNQPTGSLWEATIYYSFEPCPKRRIFLSEPAFRDLVSFYAEAEEIAPANFCLRGTPTEEPRQVFVVHIRLGEQDWEELDCTIEVARVEAYL